MATTAASIASDTGLSIFHVLRITGLPYVMYSSRNPYATGPTAWTVPTGMAAKPGLMVPDDSMTQGLKDIVGGIATPERIRVRLGDFNAHDSSGVYPFFGRLFAVGRAISNTSVKLGALNADLNAATGAAGSFTARTADTFATGYVYLPAETIDVSAVATASGVTTFTIDTDGRNKWPCYVSADGATTWPPTPYYRVGGGDSAVTADMGAPYVASEPFTMVGRTAALYMGHMRPSGDVVEEEANRLCLIVGRIRDFSYQDGMFELEIESCVTDLEKAPAAPDLATAALPYQICIPDFNWATFAMGCSLTVVSSGEKTYSPGYNVTITEQTYKYPTDLLDALNTAVTGQFTAASPSIDDLIEKCNPIFVLQDIPSTSRRAWGLKYKPYVTTGADGYPPGVVINIYLANRRWSAAAVLGGASPERAGILYVLGFPPGTDRIEGDISGDDFYEGYEGYRFLWAEGEPPGVFVPVLHNGTVSLLISGEGTGGTGVTPTQRFFATQAADERAWVRLGGSHVVEITGKTAPNTLLLKNMHPSTLHSETWSGDINEIAYVVTGSDFGHVEQVIVTPDNLGGLPKPDNAAFIGRLLCSNWDNSVDGEYDVYPEGVGMGYNALVNKDSLRLGFGVATPGRLAIIDRTTTFGELWNPIGRETHSFIVWDAENEQLRVRRLEIPTAASAATFVFNESNRIYPHDTTRVDPAIEMVRVGWKINYQWSPRFKKYKSDIGFTDQTARAMFQVAARMEELKDPTLQSPLVAIEILKYLSGASVYYRYPWVKCTRSVNRTALTLSPGTIHQVIDNTIHNPYTGDFGITSADRVYALLTEVTRNPGTGDVRVEYIIPGQTDYLNMRPWSPSALVDMTIEAENAGGFDSVYYRGYSPAAKKLYLARHYTANATAANKDAIDFAVGDTVKVVPRDNDGAHAFQYEGTIATIATDGSYLTFTADIAATGLGGTSYASGATAYHWVMILQKYTSATTARQGPGTSAVSFMGDSALPGIMSTTTRLHRFQ